MEKEEELTQNEDTQIESDKIENDHVKLGKGTENAVPEDKPKTKRKPVSIIMELLTYAFIIYACVYLIPTYVMQRTIVDGPSMEKTLHNKESLLVDKIVYKLDGLNRFDIIVFYPYGRDVEDYFVKRIIGLPGETVQIKGSDIYINDKLLKENYGKDPIDFQGLAEEPITLGKDEFFVLGDNREISMDSRYEEVGLVSRKNIGGRAMIRIWPLKKFGAID